MGVESKAGKKVRNRSIDKAVWLKIISLKSQMAGGSEKVQ